MIGPLGKTLTRLPYACADRYVVRPPGKSARLSRPVTFRCVGGKEKTTEKSAKNSPPPLPPPAEDVSCSPKGDPRGDGRICVPRCCEDGEVFDVAAGKCAEAR